MITKETYTYTGQENLPNPFWQKFFSMSEEGQTYTVLKTTDFIEYPVTYQVDDVGMVERENLDENGIPFMEMVEMPIKRQVTDIYKTDLVMCNTEYEMETHKPFYDLCKEYTNPKVLSIGYGLGFILDEMESQNADLTIVEKYQEVLDLDDRDTSDVIVGDINTMNMNVFGLYDVIFLDSSETTETIEELKEHLKPNGKFIEWNHLPSVL